MYKSYKYIQIYKLQQNEKININRFSFKSN